MFRTRVVLFLSLAFLSADFPTVADAESIQLVSAPALSPDGKTVAFSWRSDIWKAPAAGGEAVRLTMSDGRDGDPKFSPDGKTIAFVSSRTGSMQIFVMPSSGGKATQITYHTEGCRLMGWHPDGKQLLILAGRDHFWRRAERFFLIENKPRPLERLLFDAYGADGRLSADGSQLLFTREGTRWWRKGYEGSQSSQVWKYDLNAKKFKQVVSHPKGCRYPLWSTGNDKFYYVSSASGAFNLVQRDLATGQEKQLTQFKDDSVVSPAISRDGKTIVFRHLFDLYRISTDGGAPAKIELTYSGEEQPQRELRRTVTRATDVAFSKSGLDIAFIAGGDVWVMDTVLREPKQITNTPEEERNVYFAPDGKSIIYVSDSGGQSDIWSATRSANKLWWQNTSFTTKKLTNDAEMESNLEFSPDGKWISFVKSRGDLWIMRPDGKEAKRLVEAWSGPDYDWSPDSKWLAFAMYDDDFNRDVYVMPVDGSKPPFNLSRHPDNDYNPVWSPDGKMIAFIGRRVGTETDINYVTLQAKESEISSRDRKVKAALEKYLKSRRTRPSTSSSSSKTSKSSTSPTASKSRSSGITIDFEGIRKRVRRVSVPNATERSLHWSTDSKRLAFYATINGKSGTYTIGPPLSTTPKLLTATTGSSAKWLSTGIGRLTTAGVPSLVSSTGSVVSYSFSLQQRVDVGAKYKAAFDQCWRVMRDSFYDGTLNHKNWDAIRRKYQEAAAQCTDSESFSRVVSLMLGELNGSHLGFRASRTLTRSANNAWTDTTAHLGVRFVQGYKGPGLKIKDTILRGPAARVASRMLPGEIILSIDGTTVDPEMELTKLLNGNPNRDIELKVRDAKGKDRKVVIRPTSYGAARASLYEKWIADNQKRVEKASKGKLAYMHIQGMNFTSFYRFEKELYEVAAGKDGIVIDVRENGGGSTTDHLLTILTQPVHAITVPRGGGQGYPQDRKVYASWHKPVIVLCNQNSFSNAEIFSHAIKALKRGKLVGVPTAGGVISTGSARIMDVGTLRRPFRGWYLAETGEDMELHGAVPHHTIWPAPGEWPGGKDRQLDKAIAVLKADVAAWKKRPRPSLRKASDRRKK